MISKVLVVLVLGPLLLYNVTESCGRVPATPRPTTPPPVTTPRATINDSVRSLPCTENETKEAGCLNDGTCFVLVVGYNKRETSCLCTPEYRGETCEELNIDILVPSVEDGGVATAGIAASLAVLTVIIIVFTGVAIVYFKRRKEERRQRRAASKALAENGKLPENHTQPRPLSRPNSQHLPSDRYSLLNINGSPNSNGTSMSPPNCSPENGNAEEYSYKELSYNEDEIEYIDENDIDELTPMNNTETLQIEDKILLTKTTSV